MEQRKLCVLSQNMLKIIAAVCMVIDHIGAELFPDLTILRIIGRLSFPLFSYFIYEGCKYTHNKLRYFFQVFALGILCIIGYYVYSREIFLNVLITFSLSICVLYVVKFFKGKASGSVGRGALGAVLSIACILAVYVLCSWMRVDYGFFGIMLPVFAEIFDDGSKQNKVMPLAGFSIGLLLLAIDRGGTQYFGLFAIVLLALYSGERGKWRMKYFFYWFYPLHLIVIGAISAVIG
ncbi:MAG: conjugal transfer protein TraX [Ruminococcus sp.]|nr:conjugal transfer protein TraX [Ruminococcus sp.]